MAVVYFLPSDKAKSKSNSNSSSCQSPDSSTSHTQSHSHSSSSNKKSKRRSTASAILSLYDIMDKNELKIMCLALFDLMCGIISFLSLVWSGSAVFQLVYSSIIIVTATFRHFLLPNKKLTVQQWFACCIVTFGLLLSGFGNGTNSKHQHAAAHSSIADSIYLAFRSLLWPLITTILYAIEYVLIEMLLQGKNAPSDNELCYKMGFYGLIVVCCYIVCNVVPQWNNVFIHEIFVHNGSGRVIVVCYAFIFLSNFMHNWTYFMLLHASGAVSTGINQAVRAVGVFVISGICFCELQEAQCFNSFKFLSLIIVTIGVLRYAFITAMSQRNKSKELYMVAIDSDKHFV